MKKVPKMKLADKLHHGFVYVCIGASIFAAMNLIYIGYNYYKYIKPLRQQQQLRQKQDLLDEGIGFDGGVPNSS